MSVVSFALTLPVVLLFVVMLTYLLARALLLLDAQGVATFCVRSASRGDAKLTQNRAETRGTTRRAPLVAGSGPGRLRPAASAHRERCWV